MEGEGSRQVPRSSERPELEPQRLPGTWGAAGLERHMGQLQEHGLRFGAQGVGHLQAPTRTGEAEPERVHLRRI